jgi:adenylate cyclase
LILWFKRIKKTLLPFYRNKNFLLASIIKIMILIFIAFVSYWILQLQNSLLSGKLFGHSVVKLVLIFVLCFYLIFTLLDLFFQYIRIVFRSNKSFIIIQSIIQTLIIYLILNYYINHLVINQKYFLSYIFTNHLFNLFILFAFLITFLYNISMYLVRFNGENMLYNLMINRYKHDIAMQKIVMFMDITDSTKHVSRLGNAVYSKFIRDYFYDISLVVDSTMGKIYRIIGDEIIIVWDVNKIAKKNYCLDLFFNAQNMIHARSKHYLKKYGFVPSFKAGMHMGELIKSTVGYYNHIETTFIGDTLNITSRIIDKSKKLNHSFIISSDLYNYLNLDEYNYMFEYLGEFELKGVNQAVGLYGITRKSYAKK